MKADTATSSHSLWFEEKFNSNNYETGPDIWLVHDNKEFNSIEGAGTSLSYSLSFVFRRAHNQLMASKETARLDKAGGILGLTLLSLVFVPLALVEVVARLAFAILAFIALAVPMLFLKGYAKYPMVCGGWGAFSSLASVPMHLVTFFGILFTTSTLTIKPSNDQE